MNMELHNIREFEVVPQECVDYIGNTSCGLKKDGFDAWAFDVDDTLLSIVPYQKKHDFGGEKLNWTSLEEWMSKGKGPALEHSLKLFNVLKDLGVQIILVSSRREHLRSTTIDNIVNVGYHGWTSPILRGPSDELKQVQQYKAGVRRKLIGSGYRIWGSRRQVEGYRRTSKHTMDVLASQFSILRCPKDCRFSIDHIVT
ncbi:unnamed protein product [Ilex paraguariensis]|uniref:Acid phosphatase 1 n=1 Tax=Ilex paraguariensis TaxID=185542 RepID=A0ABC8RBV8_9AQUA